MAQDNVVIIGSLNDQELKNSIDSLVKHVERGTQQMATAFDNTITDMKKKLQSLGNISIDMSGSSDGGSSRRSKKVQEETQSVKSLTISYDQLAAATQRAMQSKSAQDSFYTFLQSYREHAAALAKELKQMPSASLDKQFAEYQRFESEIMRVQDKIRDLRTQLNEVGKNPNATRFEIKAITDEIGLLENKIRQLTSEQIANTRRIANEDNAAFLQKKALYDKTLQIIREMTVEEKQSTSAIMSQVDAQEQLNRKVQRQAEIIRQRMAESGNQFATWGNAVIYDPSIKKDHASIEEQLLQAHQQQLKVTQERIAAEQKESGTKQETLAITQQQVQAEQQVTQAQQQRSGVKATPKTFQNYEDFRAALAHVLGLQQQEIKLADEETASYNKLSATLKTLQSAYNQLSAAERNSDNGKTLVASMHEVQRAMQQIQQQAARPVNLQSALGLSEKTLDDIAYKLRMLQSYRSGLDLNKQSEEVKRTTQEIDRLQKKQNEVIGSTRRWAKENNAVTRSLEYMKNRLAFIFTVGAATNFVKQIYDIRGQYELLERSIGILVDSMQQGSQIFAELNAMAIKSPFTTMELGAAAKQLTAYDIAAKDVVDTTKRLADMAAAVGVPIERLTYALGQIKAYGYLNARDARMFANAGIPLVQELADRYTELEGRLVSVGDVYDRIKKKAISFEDVLDVINNITDEGGRFFNFQEKAADTLKVKLANLTLAFNNMMNEIGKSNQSLLTMPLTALKTLFEHWRDINNIMRSVAVSFGLIKLAQIAYYVWMRNATLAAAAHVAVGAKLVTTLTSLKAAFVGFVTNPFAMAIAGLTLMGVLLAKAVFDYRDLQQANEDFNRSIANNADENIKSIDKFFDEYKKQLDGIGGENTAAQQKMWERLREEIEKASKSAQTYLQILNNIGDVSKRISAGRDVLEQIQEINKEAKSLAERELFSVGGGFADDSLAKNLREYEQQFNELIKDFGSLENAAKDAASETAEAGEGISFHSWWNYLDILKEAERELDKFSSVLDNANLEKVMGDGTPESQLANIREFTSIIRDGFLATEQGQKVSASGRALLNKQLDEWIANQGVANKLINEERATIERNRTAWETFFNQLSKKDKERLDYMVATNQTGSKDFQEIWDKATKNMIENANTSYLQIQDQIANLRNIPDIVIKVVYRETKEKLDAQQEQYQKDFLIPQGGGLSSPEEYFEEIKKLNEKYGRFQKKEGEDNVEWEKRLGDEYRKNEESIKKLNRQLKDSANLSDVDKKAKEGELNALVDQNKVLDQIKDKQNFDYSKKTKGGKKDEDIVAEALKQELSIIKEMQSNYSKLRKAGVSDTDALRLSTQGYELTLERVNSVLQKFGISKFNASDFAGKNVRQLLDSLTQQRDTLLASGKVKTSSLKDLDVEIQKLTVDAKAYDMKKITDGLNSELGKLKDEYELAIELDANPELGDMFSQMFGIDTSTMPRNINEYMDKVQQAFENVRRKLGYGMSLDVFKANEDDWKAWGERVGLSGEALDSFKAKFVAAQDVAKKWAQNTINQTKDLQYKLADNAGKIAIEEKKLADLEKQLANEVNVEQRRLLELRIQDQRNAIAKLKEEILQTLPTYQRLFGETAEHSAYMTRRLAKNYKDMLNDAKSRGKNERGEYTVVDPVNGKTASISEERLGKEFKNADKELQKTQNIIGKIRESFRKGKDGIIDWVGGIENIGEAMGQVGDLIDAIGNVYDMFGNPNEYSETSEAIHDIATSLQGVNTAAKGIGQIAAGDYIGGAISVISGVSSAIGAWFDNSNKKIDQQIKNSERNVKKLELAYIDLEYEVSKAYGTAAIGANKAAIANKELQLVELKRQLALEQSRKSKDRDEDKIIDLQKQIKELEYDIKDATNEIINDLLGISSIGDAMESMMDGFIEALRNGEDAMVVFNESIDNMIANVVKKMYVTKVLMPWFEKMWDYIAEDASSRVKALQDDINYDVYKDLASKTTEPYMVEWSEKEQKYMYEQYSKRWGTWVADQLDYTNYHEFYKSVVRLYESGGITADDIIKYAEALRSGQPIIEGSVDELNGLLSELGLINTDASKQLSALQQGIQGITEDTAGAIEAYLNGVSQQVYLHSDLLTQIRDTIIGFDLDVQTATLSQMLLQLQQSYQVQQSIEGILQSVLNPSGRAFMVELNS